MELFETAKTITRNHSNKLFAIEALKILRGYKNATEDERIKIIDKAIYMLSIIESINESEIN
jgi:hypothetical protein